MQYGCNGAADNVKFYNMDRVLTTSDEIKALIREAVGEAIEDFHRKQVKKEEAMPQDALTFKGALFFLEEMGYPIKDSTLRNKIAANDVPYSKVGGRVIFSRNELTDWIEVVKSKPYSRVQGVVAQLAKSATNQGA